MEATGRQTWRVAAEVVASTVLAAGVLLALWVGFYDLTLPDESADAAQPVATTDGEAGAPLDIAGRQLKVVIGRGIVRDDSLLINGYEFYAIDHNAVAIRRGSLQAARFPYLEYAIDGTNPGLSVNFSWRSTSDPRRVYSQALNARAGSPAVLQLQGLEGWQGTIIEVGIHVVAHDPRQSALIEHLRFAPADWRLALASQLTAWTAFRGWNQRSINFLLGKNAENGLSPLPVIAAWAALSALVFCWVGWLRGRQRPAGYAVIALLAWMAMDLLWQFELNAQVRDSRFRFADKSMQERHEADLDAWVYRYVMRLKSEFLPAEPARVIVIHDARKHHYDRLKAQYYLLPHNVYNFDSGLE
ncbi:MAG: hypothetical protein KDI09_14690, partial [Halioglobus sp.]|nr:hypothetical protein [Halioglobus sp.]